MLFEGTAQPASKYTNKTGDTWESWCTRVRTLTRMRSSGSSQAPPTALKRTVTA